MTDSNHPITPSLELLKHWEEQHFDEGENYDVMLIQAYQAGADAELEACCELITSTKVIPLDSGQWLHSRRRPKPPSLKEQAMDELNFSFSRGYLKKEAVEAIRRALESLPE
jgi:hypothetical protein